MVNKKVIAGVVGVVVIVFLALAMFSGGEDTTEPKELNLQNVTFCSEKPADYQDYQKQPNSTYTMPEQGTKTFWMYADVNGVSYEEVEQGKRVYIDAYLTVKSPEGNPIFDNEQIVNEPQIYSEDIDLNKYYLVPSFSLQDIGQLDTSYGDYTVKIKIVDSIAGETDSVTTRFTIEEG